MVDLSGIAWFDLCRRVVSSACMLWLAFRFGRSLLTSHIPLIEQIARVSTHSLSMRHQRYVRHLTWVWFIYFLVVSAVSAVGVAEFPWDGLTIAVCSVVFFVLEHQLRPYVLPGQRFPNLLVQLQHTWRVWRQPSSLSRLPRECSK